MKRLLSGILLILLFFLMLCRPKAVFHGAEEGLLLWYQVVFPTLFPFMLITGLLMESGGLDQISGLFSGGIQRIFRVSRAGSFAVLAGFLCGYPMGAKVTADLLRSGRIRQEEGSYLLSFCNNASPAFILNFIVWKTLDREDLAVPTLAILFLSPVLLSFLFRRIYHKRSAGFSCPSSRSAPGREGDFAVLDSCMVNSVEAIVKVGGYIVLFSVLTALAETLPVRHPVIRILTPLLEITNGIVLLKGMNEEITLAYPLILGLTAFGGLCSVAQTQSMIQGTGLKILPYMAQKLAAAGAASLMALIYLWAVR